MRAPIAILAASATILAATGCAGPDDRTPVACRSGANAYLAALREAPGEVRLKGRVPLGDCLPETQKGGDLAAVGAATVLAVTKLNARARANPGGSANLQLGYLLGVVEERAERTGGIHDELLRRLTTAARYSPGNRPLPARFMRTYRQGQKAGHSPG
jgi:hypothetical protein